MYFDIITYYIRLIDVGSYARKKKKYLMEIDFLTDMTKSLETHLNKALNQIAEDNVRIVEATDKIKTLEMEISKM